MLVAELITILSSYPQDAKVVCTWKGNTADIGAENVYLSHKTIRGLPAGSAVIDADENFYKADFDGESL